MSAQLNWAVLWPLCPYLELCGPIWTQIRSFPHIEYYKTLSFSQFISSLLFWNVDPCRPNYSNQSRNIRRKHLISEISCPCQSSQQGPWWSAEGVGKKCFIISFPVGDCLKKKYVTFLKRLKGGFGLENIETLVQLAEELESLSQPSKKVLLIAKRIRKETAELSENNSCPPPSNLPSTPTNPPSKRKREDRSPSASSSHGLFEENSILRDELAATKEKLRLSEEHFDNLHKILIQQIEG